MKRIYLLLISILFALYANKSIAQNVIDTSKEEKYERETYVINNTSQSSLRAGTAQIYKSTNIYNKNRGEVEGHSVAGGCYNLKETTPLTEVFKKAIPKEKIKSLSFDDKNRMLITFIYNINTGKVINLQFILLGNITLSNDSDSETDITIKDIYNLESLFKEYYFDVPENCVNHETHDIYGNYNRVFGFSKLLADEEKENNSSF